LAVRALADFKAVVPVVAAFEPAMRASSDADLRAVMGRLRERVVAGDRVEDVSAEVFAAVREAARRSIGQRHRDVQVMAGAALCAGTVAEMADGEGKTLTATLPACVGALTRRGAHVVTTAPDVARRDAERMAPVYETLGLTVGVVPDTAAKRDPDARPADKQARVIAYQADVTYGSCDDLALDHLRDNLVASAGDGVQRGHALAIVDDAEYLLVGHPLGPCFLASHGADGERTVLAQVTRRGFLLLYERLCGLSSTVAPAEAALEQWFGLDVVQIPLDRPTTRVDHADVLYLDAEERLSALDRLVADRHARGQPILIYAPERRESEAVERMLHGRRIEPAVLDTMPDLAALTREMAELGRLGRVSVLRRVPSIADVPLGGVAPDGLESRSTRQDERRKVIEAGGLLVLGLSRHDVTRRLDQRLCELAGRRGEPGETQFLLLFDDEDIAEMDDDADDRRHRLRALVEDGDDSPFGGVTRFVATMQWAAEAEWIAESEAAIALDDIAVKRSSAYHAARAWALAASDAEVDGELARLGHTVGATIVQQRCPPGVEPAHWDLDGIVQDLSDIAGSPSPRRRQLKGLRAAGGDRALVARWPEDAFAKAVEARRTELGTSILARVTQQIAQRLLDQHWRLELQRLADERAHILSLPEGEQAAAVAAAQRAAPPDVDLGHELIARDLLRYLLQVEIKVRQPPEQ
jgi:preprotein translocase subunit SecA